MNDKILSIIITAKDEASAVMAKVATATDAASAKIAGLGASMESAGKSMESTGSTMTRSFTVPIALVGGASIKMAMDFQQAMTYVRTDAGDTTDNIDQLSNSVLNLAKASQFSPDELANGLYHLASLGLRGADAMNALNTAQKMASVGGADLESTASALGAALVTGIKGVQDYSDAAGTLDAIIGAGNMRMQDLVGSLGTGVLTAFKNAGLSLKEYGAALATLTDNGMDATESATRLRMTIAMMTAPTGPAIDALKRLGMTQDQLGMDMQTKGLVPALQDLKKHLNDTYGTTAEGRVKMQQALSDMFGGGRSSSAIITLLDQLERVGNKEKQIGDQSGEFASKVAEQQQTASAKLKTAWSSVQADLIKLGDELLPRVSSFLGRVAGDVDTLMKKWDALTPFQKKVIGDLGLFLAVAGPSLSIIGKLVTGIGNMVALGTSMGKITATLVQWAAKAVIAAATWTAQFAVMAAKAIANAAIQAAQAAVAGAAWVAQAIKAGAEWTAQFAVMVVRSTPAAIIMAAKAADVGLAWVINAVRASFAWVTQELPKIVVSFGVTAASATVEATVTSAAWVASAARTSFSWVVTELPKIVGAFLITSEQGAVQAAIVSGAWILSASQTAIAWVVTELPRIIAAFVAMSASAVVNAAVASGAMIASAATSSAAWIASTASTSASVNALRALIATPMFMPAIVVTAALASLYEVLKAAQTVIETVNVVKSMNAGIAADRASQQAAISQLEAGTLSSDPAIRNRSMTALHNLKVQGYAEGGFTGQGSRNTIAGIVHAGEYVIPRQSVDQKTGLPKVGSTFNMYGSINLGSADAVNQFFTRLDAQREMAAIGVGV